MPDTRRHRGAHPQDEHDFAPEALPRLRAATADLAWLRGRRYPEKAALTLVGDRYQLRRRQRLAVGRCAASDAEVATRSRCRLRIAELAGRELWIDGYNVLLTVEAALSGGVVLGARDGTYRDLTAMSRHYRRVEETRRAIDLLGEVLATLGIASCRWLLDRPISNSGRLAGEIRRRAEEHGWAWRVDLVVDPDGELVRLPVAVATADSGILGRGPAWFNFARLVVDRLVPAAWVVDLSGGAVDV